MANRTPDMPAHPSDQQRQQIAYPNTQTIIGEPLPNAEYEWHEAVECAYRQHALGKGYGVVKVDRRVQKALKVNPEVHESKRRKGTSSSKCNCPFRIVAIEDPVTLKFKAFIKEHHNHDPSSEPTSYPSGAQVLPTCRNRRSKWWIYSVLGGLTAVQWLCDTLQELRWFCRFE
ncbi:hypothetical protein V8E54_009428, partial [Elaphomyces granulatus]